MTAANTSGQHDYFFTDAEVSSIGARVLYYRIRQVDQDNKFTYSQIIVLSMGDRNVVLFYPNPVTDKAYLSITIDKPEQLVVRLIDNAGRVIRQGQWNLPVGNSSIPVEIKELTKGLYYLDVKGNNGTSQQLKFIEQ